MMAVMGGMRSFWGPLLGAAVFVVLQDYLSSITVNWMSFVGLLFVLVVLFFPRGLLGVIRRKSEVMSLLRGQERHQALRQSGRRRRHIADGQAGRIARHHRAERRRQDDVLQHDQRLSAARRPAASFSTDATSRRYCRRADVSASASRAPSRSPRSFPSSRCSKIVRIAVEVAAGYPPAPVDQSRDEDGEVRAPGRRDARDSPGLPPKPIGWSASSRMATSAPPRS